MINFLIEYSVWLWLGVFILMVIIEIATIDFVTIWFAGSALPTLVVAAIWPEQLVVQLAIFIVGGVLLLILSRPALVKYFQKNVTHTNVDSYVGKTAIVAKAISPIDRGLVLFERDTWTAVSSKKIEEGAKVRILAIEGNKFVVEEIKESR